MSRGNLPVNEQQEAVVDHVLGHPVTVVSAGAGSGKTFTTVATVVELILQHRASAENFVLITFTNKAANELRDRIRSQLRGSLANAAPEDRPFWRRQIERLGVAYVGTIHGFCSQLLRRYGYEQAVAKQAQVSFSNRIRRAALKDALEAYDQQPPLFGKPNLLRPFEVARLVGNIYDATRNRGFSPEEVLARTAAQQPDPGKVVREGVARMVADFHRRYTSAKAEAHALDTQDLLEATARMLKAEPAVAKRVGKRVRYLFVDEFQDTDHIQKSLIDCLIPHTDGVLVVGDNKQSIYAFRGADVSLVDQLADDNSVDVLPLSISRRPTLPLLAAQNALFTSLGRSFPRLNMPLAPHPEAFTPSPGPTAFKLLSAASQFDPALGRQVAADREQRAEFVARVVKEMLGRPVDRGPDVGVRPIQPGDIVVLTRTNESVQAYAQALASAGVSARADRGEQFYDAPETVAVYRLLRLVLHYPHDGVVSQALDTPYLAHLGGEVEEARLVQYGAVDGYPLVDWLETTHPEVAGRLAALRERVRIDTVSQLLRRLYDQLGVTEFHRCREEHSALLNLERLRDIARSASGNEEALSLRQFLDFLRAAIIEGYEEDFAAPTQDDDERPPFVRLMTIHRSKGLEFPIVVIPEARSPVVHRTRPQFLLHELLGLDVQAIPEGAGRTTSDRFEEELFRGRALQLQEGMRLLYVAVTRASHAVVLCGHRGLRPGDRDFWSWQDEVLEARAGLEAAGAVFWEGG